MTEIGAIFHLGIYSVPAYDDVKSLSRRKTKNGSEWYLARLIENGKFRPISGYKETQKYHSEHYQEVDYFDFADQLNKKKIIKNIDEWIKIVKSYGGTYMLLTAKHHDGFCLWDTETTKHKSSILKYFFKKVKKSGLEVGFYYSWMEFLHKPNKEYIDNIMIPQINELYTLSKKYDVKRKFFDGNWIFNTKYAESIFNQYVQLFKELNIELVFIKIKI